MLKRYRASGRFSPLIFAGALVLFFIASLIGLEYQRMLDRPGNSRTAMLVIATCVGLGLISWWCAVLCKCRSAWCAALVGHVASVFSLGASHALKHRQAVSAGAPASVVGNLLWRAAHGIGSNPAQAPPHVTAGLLSGPVAFTVWTAEALTMCVGGMIGGTVGSRRPFCENCDRYAWRVLLKARIADPPGALVDQVKSARSMEDLLVEPSIRPPPTTAALVYRLPGCPACNNSNTLTVTLEIERYGAMFSWLAGWWAWLRTGAHSWDLQADVVLSPSQTVRLTEWDRSLKSNVASGNAADALPGDPAEPDRNL